MLSRRIRRALRAPALLFPEPRQPLAGPSRRSFIPGFTPGILLGGGGGGGEPGGGFSVNHVGNYSSDTSSATHTFTDVGIGVNPAENRKIVALIVGKGGTAPTLSGVTFGGVSAAVHESTPAVLYGSSVRFCVGIASLDISSGTTSTIVATFSDSVTRCDVIVYEIEGCAADVVDSSQRVKSSSSGSETLIAGVDTVVGGAVLGVGGKNNTGAPTWLGLNTNTFELSADPSISISHRIGTPTFALLTELEQDGNTSAMAVISLAPVGVSYVAPVLPAAIAPAFAGATDGFWFDQNDENVWFQDSHMTMLAGADDPVAVILDKSGNGNHAGQSNASLRQTRRFHAGSGNWYLEWGGDGYMTVSRSAAMAQPNTVAALIQRQGTDNQQWVTDGSGGRHILALAAFTNFAFYAGSWLQGGVAADNDWHAHIAEANGASGSIATDGGTATTGNTGTQTFGPRIHIGSGNDGTAHRLTGNLGDLLVCNKLLSSGEKDDLLAYMTAKQPS
jgi:hypothetical protein